ncbi:MAG: NRDE family protein [Actinomycetota bacterium]|nr:NRDE family protein [Actinomycetota bacterium]
MCLLVVVHQVVPGAPLVVAANRDERLDRPARAMAVLADRDPRVLGGRDEVAGGTWLAVNEHGVVAGLTNEPTGEQRDATRRSRGELPVFLARHRDAASAVEALVASARPSHYNPSWLLVGDRRRLLSVDMTGRSTAGDRPVAAELGPGVHVLENRPPGAPSAKVDHVRDLVAAALAEACDPRSPAIAGVPGGGGAVAKLVASLARILADHQVTASDDAGGPLARSACCVHGDEYGTRSALLVTVGERPSCLPSLQVADGRPCTASFTDATAWWRC